jgi:glucans biosynthesis protein
MIVGCGDSRVSPEVILLTQSSSGMRSNPRNARQVADLFGVLTSLLRLGRKDCAREIDRRAFVKAAAVAAFASTGVASRSAVSQDAVDRAKQNLPFSFDWLVSEAKRLASAPFQPMETDLPAAISDLTYDQYRDIWFTPEAAIWADTPTGFRLDLFHLGWLHRERVRIALLEEGRAIEIPFSTDLFTYGHLVRPPDGADGLGFSGFRARYPINAQSAHQEFLVFQGASYFRAVARNQVYGLSARGLAVDTAEPKGEEFPAFRRFWIERPPRQADTLVLYALLDSLSLTGAYRFDIRPGAETVIEVSAAIFTRQEVGKAGVAPLTSMFLFNAMNRGGFDDYRRAVHDSEGLQMLTGAGEWLWRPLGNPRDLQVSSFSDRSPRGFGLVQRARRFEEYEDAEAKYEKRPSVWIEPIGDWGRGYVELVEIPTEREINDNIVAYWRPDRTVPAGGPWRFRYRMRWTDTFLPDPNLLWASTSRAGLSFDQERRLFAIDFRNGNEGGDVDRRGLAMEVSTSHGSVVNPRIHENQAAGALRVSFELAPGSADLSELRLLLTRDGKPASETWLYRWSAS